MMRLTPSTIVAAVSLMVSPLWAGNTGAPTDKDLDRVLEQVAHMETAKTGISLSGYVDAGYVYNFNGAASTVATQGYVTDGFSRGDFNLNAVKLVLEKPLGEGNTWQAGFRVDWMVGEDVSTFINRVPGVFPAGNSDNMYIQQGLVIVRAPLGNGLDIQAGRINSILGFEADERPANLNITLGVNSFFDPGPAAGVLLIYPLNDRVTLLGGINNGNGLSTSRGVNDGAFNFEADDGYAFNAGIRLANEKGNAETQVAAQFSPWGDEGAGMTENEGLLGLNWWGSWAPGCCCDKLILAFNTSLWAAGDFSAPAVPGPATDDGSTFATVALYAKYQFNGIFSLAARAEYAHADDDQFLGIEPGFAPLQGSSDLTSWTLTAGFDLLENLLLRAEYRIDAGSDVVSSGGEDNANMNHMIATQAVFSF